MLKRVAIGFLVVLSVFAITAVFALVTTQNANNAACEEANDVRNVLTNVLTRAQVVAAQNEEFTAAEKEAAQKFYNQSLSELAKHHC